MCIKRKLRPLLWLVGVLLLSAIQSHAAPPSGYVLDWSDEFDGSSLDTTKWNYRVLGPRNDAVNTTNAVSVANGVLTITTYTESGTNFTGMIGTSNLFMPRYGYLEARINFNDSPGEWSAFWMTAPTMGIVGDPTCLWDRDRHCRTSGRQREQQEYCRHGRFQHPLGRLRRGSQDGGQRAGWVGPRDRLASLCGGMEKRFPKLLL